jgi:hypothetical protein
MCLAAVRRFSLVSHKITRFLPWLSHAQHRPRLQSTSVLKDQLSSAVLHIKAFIFVTLPCHTHSTLTSWAQLYDDQSRSFQRMKRFFFSATACRPRRSYSETWFSVSMSTSSVALQFLIGPWPSHTGGFLILFRHSVRILWTNYQPASKPLPTLDITERRGQTFVP